MSGVRIPDGSPSAPIFPRSHGGIAQLVRVPASHAGGHRFEPCCLHQKTSLIHPVREVFLVLVGLLIVRFYGQPELFIVGADVVGQIMVVIRLDALDVIKLGRILEGIVLVFNDRGVG